jgi:hypothetical protein
VNLDARAWAAGRATLRGLGWIAAWVLLGLLLGGQTLLYAWYAGRHPAPRNVLLVPVLEMLAWAPLAAFAVWLAQRHPFERGRIRRALLVHVPVALLLASLQSLLVGAALWSLGELAAAKQPMPRLFVGLVVGKFGTNLLTYATVLAAFLALDYRRRMHDRELRASQLEARLAEARLDVLRMQLQPHFLFNTLHSISTLMHRDAEAADRMLVRLADLLRLSMELDGARDIPLSREMQFLDAYVQIQAVRFGDRLRIRTQVDPAALDAPVPTLLLQPLVENAIQHGIGHRAAGGTIEIVAVARAGELVIEVADDGPGWNGAPRNGGRGLANTRARLEHVDARARLECVARAAGGAVVRVILPLPSGPSAGRAGSNGEIRGER